MKLIPAVLALALAAPAAAETTKLVYAMPVTVPAVIPYVALDKGFFKEEGLEVEAKMFSSGREALQALLAGQAQLQSVSETPVVHAILQGNPIVVIATAARHKEAKLLARKDKGILKAADLKGKKVATLPGTNSDYFMYRFLEANGIPKDQVKIANMPPPEMIVAYAKGEIDGYFAWEPHIQYGLGQVPDSTLIGPGKLYEGRLTVNMDPKFVKENPETVRKVIRALLKAEAWVKANQEEAIKHVAARLKLDEGVLRRLWKENEFKVELDKSLVPTMTSIGKWAAGLSGGDKTVPDFRQSIHDEALRKERPASVSL